MDRAEDLRIGFADEHGRDVQRAGDAALHEVEAADGQKAHDVCRSRRPCHSSAAAVGVDLIDFERQLFGLANLSRFR